MRLFGFVCLVLYCTSLFAQRSVLPSQRHERLVAIVPMTGAGTAADPKRPLFTNARGVEGTKFLSVTTLLSDDGRFALVEFVAADRAAFAPILQSALPEVKRFDKGQAAKDDIDREFRKYRKDFDLSKLGAFVK